jgi:Heat shock protein
MHTTSFRLAIGLALLTLVGSLAACSGGPALADRQFLSVAITDGGVDHPLLAGTRIRLGFQATQLSASAGCNTIGGSYHIDGGRLILDAVSMTEMGCDAGRNAQDSWLAALLGSKPTITLNGDELVLESGSIVVRLLDRKVVEPDRALVGPTWTVESIISGDAVSSAPSDATATLVFNADGTLTVFTGCNQGGATWKTTAGGIEISDLVLTKKACFGSGGQLESAVVTVLRGSSITSSIDSNVLTLQAGANGLQLRAP